jgi:hypothetical protein
MGHSFTMKSKKEFLFVVLSDADLHKATEQVRILTDAEKQVSMLRFCHQAYWQELAKKYKLPAEFDMDPEGRIFIQGEVNE